MKRYFLAFAAIGYLIPVLHYTRLLHGVAGEVLWYSCLTCLSVTGVQAARLKFALFVLAPINAAIYGCLGLLTSSIVRAARNRHGRDGRSYPSQAGGPK